MALTKIHTGSSLISFLQPEVGDNINITLDNKIDWINQGTLIYIPNSGIYEVVQTLYFQHTLKLKISHKQSGSNIIAKTLFPISNLGNEAFTKLNYIKSDGVNQVFSYEGNILSIVSIDVNGLGLRPEQYNIYEGTFEILDELSETDYIELKYYKI